MAESINNLPANAGDIRDAGLSPGLGRSPGRRNGNPLQYSCLENPKDRGTWWATVHGSQGVGHNWSDLAHMYLCPCLSLLEPMNVTLYGKKKFSDVLKLRILRWGDYPCLCVWAWNHHDTSDKGDAGAELAEKAIWWQGQNWSDVLWRASVHKPRKTGGHWRLEEEIDPLLKASERNQSRWHLTLVKWN